MNLKNIFAASVCGAMMVACAGNNATVKVEKGLKDAVGDKFLIGTALNVWQSGGIDTSAVKIVKRHFNAIL